MRNLIIRKLREAREAAALVFQKYTRGRVPRLVYRTARYFENVPQGDYQTGFQGEYRWAWQYFQHTLFKYERRRAIRQRLRDE
jgi:hypothetical protein